MAIYGFTFRSALAYGGGGDSANHVVIYNDIVPSNFPYPQVVTFPAGNITCGYHTAGMSSFAQWYATFDPRIRGYMNNASAGTQNFFRIDLPTSGDWKTRLAMGGNNGNFHVEVRDTTTPVATYTWALPTDFELWMDAGGTIRNETDWPALNTQVTRTFSTTQCNLVLGNGVDRIGLIAHFELEDVAAPPSAAGRIFRSRVIG